MATPVRESQSRVARVSGSLTYFLAGQGQNETVSLHFLVFESLLVSTSLFVVAAYAGQLVVGVVFAVSAMAKVRKPQIFLQTVRNYELFPPVVAVPIAASIVFLEGSLAVCLLGGVLLSIALPLTVATLSAFLVVAGVLLKQGRRVACGCFGDPEESLSGMTILRLALLSGVALFSAMVLEARGIPHLFAGGLLSPNIALAPKVEAVSLACAIFATGVLILRAKEVRFLLWNLWNALDGPEGT